MSNWMKWIVQGTISEAKPQKRQRAIVEQILINRNLLTDTDREAFLNPTSPLALTPDDVGMDGKQLAQAVGRIRAAVTAGESILIYGDYDADGITATATLWEALHTLSPTVHPFIPHRERHGYGLSVEGLKEAIAQHHPSLIITVDNGIVAHEAAAYVHSLNLDLIITDHHQKGTSLPFHTALVHTDAVAGSGVAWFVAKALSKESAASSLELVTIGTIADILPLTGVNRTLVRAGLAALQHSTRPGIRALLTEAGVADDTELTTYHINFVIAPRLNAMGRLEDAMDSLRLLCTKDMARAQALAAKLGSTNRIRQDLTQELIIKGKGLVTDPTLPLLVIDDATFHEGVIGLVAGKLAETYYRPSIVIRRGETVSKASARSVKGVNIIELIRTQEHLLINAGGHPMAAGFTIETGRMAEFKEAITGVAKDTIAPDLLSPSLAVDCAVTLSDISDELWEELEKLKPFGMGNPQPVLSVNSAKLLEVRQMGRDNTHLRLRLQETGGRVFTAVGFGMGERFEELQKQATVDVAFTVQENVWNGRRELQLQLKDVVVPSIRPRAS